MIRFLILVLFLTPNISKAEVLDNISFTINENCSMDKYISIVDEFRKNPIVQKHGYKVKILSPVSLFFFSSLPPLVVENFPTIKKLQ